jgi:hypothetical protein
VAVHDPPVLTLQTGRGTRQAYNVPGLVALLAPWAGLQVPVVLEASQGRPGHTQHVYVWAWLGRRARDPSLRLPHTRVRPRVWKKARGLGKGERQRRTSGPGSPCWVPICAGVKTTGELRRSCWRSIAGSVEAFRKRNIDDIMVGQGSHHLPTLVAAWEGEA